LKAKAAELEAAKRVNETPIKPEALQAVPIPDIKKVRFAALTAVRTERRHDGKDESEVSALHSAAATAFDADKLLQKLNPIPIQLTKLNLTMQWTNISSAFIELKVLIDTTCLPDHLRLYIELYLEAVYELPIREEDGSITPYEEVVRNLTAQTVGYSNSCGLNGGNFQCGSFAQSMGFTLKVEASKWELAVKWLQRLLFQTIFDPERLKVSCKKLLVDVPNQKREGMRVCSAMWCEKACDPLRSNYGACSFMRQLKFLNETMVKIENASDPLACSVVQDLEQFRSLLFRPDNLVVHVLGNCMALPQPTSPWFSSFNPTAASASQGQTVPPPRHRRSNSSLLKAKAILGCPIVPSSCLLTAEAKQLKHSKEASIDILGLSSIESSFMLQSMPGPDNFTHEDYAAILVCIEYLTATEGDFWREIRGLGLAYHFWISVSPEQGFLTFGLYQATDLVKAFNEAQRIVNGYADRSTKFDELTLDGAKSSCAFSIIDREATLESAGSQAFYNFLRGVGINFNALLVQKIRSVTLDDLDMVMQKYFKHLFAAQGTVTVATTPASKLDATITGFSKLGFTVSSHADLDTYFKLAVQG